MSFGDACSLCRHKACTLSFGNVTLDPADDEWFEGDVYFVTDNPNRLLPNIFHKSCFKYWAFGSGLCSILEPYY